MSIWHFFCFMIVCFVICAIDSHIIRDKDTTYTIVHSTSNISMDDPSIYGVFYNNYEHPLTFDRCIVRGGQQIGRIKPILYPGDNQRLIFIAWEANMVTQVTGDCYYYVPVLKKSYVVLDILFYHSNNGHEYYGMNNSIHYSVDIDIVMNGHPRYYLMNANKNIE